MPSKSTFSIPPIKDFVERWMAGGGKWIDPFCGNSVFSEKCLYTNDLNPLLSATHHKDSLDFLKGIDSESIDGVLFDPPYSPRQITECYKGVGMVAHMQDTQSSFYSLRKEEVSRVLKKGGIALCFGWNSQGIGKSRGMSLAEVLLVAHGGAHNDTICTAEIKS